MLKKWNVKREFIVQLAQLIPEYQHEDVSPVGNEIHRALDGSRQKFQISVKYGPETQLDLHNAKVLLRAYFHSVISLKIS